jgi:hypothetical protein
MKLDNPWSEPSARGVDSDMVKVNAKDPDVWSAIRRKLDFESFL